MAAAADDFVVIEFVARPAASRIEEKGDGRSMFAVSLKRLKSRVHRGRKTERSSRKHNSSCIKVVMVSSHTLIPSVRSLVLWCSTSTLPAQCLRVVHIPPKDPQLESES